MVIEETQKDLAAEGISAPKVSELDEAPLTDEVIEEREAEMRKIEELESTQEKIAALVESKDLEEVKEHKNIYKTKALTSGKVRYFGVFDDKIYECYIDSKGKVKKAKDEEETPAETIGAYNTAVEKANDYTSSKKAALTEVKLKNCKYPIFKATGEDTYYILKNDELLHIKNSCGIKNDKNKVSIVFSVEGKADVEVSDLSADDLEEFTEEEIVTLKQKQAKEAEEKKEKETKRRNEIIEKVQKNIYTVNARVHNVPLNELGLEETGIIGYFKTKTKPTLYFRFENNSSNTEEIGHLIYQPNIEEIYTDGRFKNKNQTFSYCHESISAEESASKLYAIFTAKNQYNSTTKKYNSLTKDNINEAKIKINSLVSYCRLDEIKTFLKAYNDKCSHYMLL